MAMSMAMAIIGIGGLVLEGEKGGPIRKMRRWLCANRRHVSPSRERERRELWVHSESFLRWTTPTFDSFQRILPPFRPDDWRVASPTQSYVVSLSFVRTTGIRTVLHS